MTAKLRKYHVGSGDKRRMRNRICSNKARVTATSASCKTRRGACRTSRAPILTSFSRRVVRLQRAISCGQTSRRRKLPRL